MLKNNDDDEHFIKLDNECYNGSFGADTANEINKHVQSFRSSEARTSLIC